MAFKPLTRPDPVRVQGISFYKVHQVAYVTALKWQKALARLMTGDDSSVQLFTWCKIDNRTPFCTLLNSSSSLTLQTAHAAHKNLSGVVIAYKVYSAASMNPVKTLRDE